MTQRIAFALKILLLVLLVGLGVTSRQTARAGHKIIIEFRPPGGYYSQPVDVTLRALPAPHGPGERDDGTRPCPPGVGARLHYNVYSYYLDADADEPSEVIVPTQPYSGPIHLTEPSIINAFYICGNGKIAAQGSQTYIVCAPNCYWLAVIGDKGEPIDHVYNETKKMVKTIEPWKYLRKQTRKIVVVPVESTADLRCRELLGESGTFPSCPEDAAAQGALAGINWTAIIVVTRVNCNCGSVATVHTPVTAVGNQVTASVIAHELGHVTGKMLDEYYYKFNYQGGPLGSNCFRSEALCRDASRDVQGAQCSLGCRSVDSWRPSTQLMHYEIGQPYGPLETCIMAEKIMDVIGHEAESRAGYPFGQCTPQDPSPDPPAAPPRPGEFYGGRR